MLGDEYCKLETSYEEVEGGLEVGGERDEGGSWCFDGVAFVSLLLLSDCKVCLLVWLLLGSVPQLIGIWLAASLWVFCSSDCLLLADLVGDVIRGGRLVLGLVWYFIGVTTLRALVHAGDQTSGDARSGYMISEDAKSWVVRIYSLSYSIIVQLIENIGCDRMIILPMMITQSTGWPATGNGRDDGLGGQVGGQGSKGLEVNWIRRIQELDTAYWGFLRVGTTFDIFQNIILIPYLEYGVLSPLDMAY
ncbi:hypothetical protein Tco_1069867 [Tanacetum coccineum]|uniref:Uncharacterized protein n=1 Tax=Tanacetum coccineum TaxID=301880 RepID=A0ABQ5HK43_9ASTR